MNNQRVRLFRYVCFAEIEAYLALGWHLDGPLPGPHGHWSCLLEWLCVDTCFPVVPIGPRHDDDRSRL